MRRTSSFGALVVASSLLLFAAVAGAQEPGGEPPPPDPPAPPVRAKVAVPAEMLGRLVVVKTAERQIEGKLVALDDEEMTIETYRMERVTVARGAVSSARLALPAGARPVAAEVSPQEEPPASVAAKPSPWGFWATLAAGPAWGQATGAITPSATFLIELSVSFHFVYVGAGMGMTWFSGASDFSNETTGGTMSSGSPVAVAGYVEGGLTKGLFFPYGPKASFELRPSVGFGYWGTGSATQSIANCSDCDSRSFAYNSSPYARFQLGAYYAALSKGSLIHRVFMSRNGFFTGGTVSLQQFVLGAQPRLERILSFGWTTGWGP